MAYREELQDYFWDHIKKKWVFIEMDTTWAFDRLFGYDSGPGERLREKSTPITGREWKEILKNEFC